MVCQVQGVTPIYVMAIRGTDNGADAAIDVLIGTTPAELALVRWWQRIRRGIGEIRVSTHDLPALVLENKVQECVLRQQEAVR